MPAGIGYPAAPGAEQAAALAAMLEQTEQAPPTVLCRVCQTEIDAETGSPVQEVTPDAVGAVRDYLSGSTDTEFGGEQLIEA